MAVVKKLDPEEAKAVNEAVRAAEEEDIAAKSKRLSGEVVGLPKVNRGKDGEVNSVVLQVKARFFGTVEVRLRGDLAAAYWSLTPGMQVNIVGVPSGDKEYNAVGLTLVPQTS